MSTSVIPEDYVKREDAEPHVGKSPKTIYRRIKRVIESGDEKAKVMLDHCLLELLDGEVVAGREIADMQFIDRQRSAGRVPTWYIDPDWFAEYFRQNDRKKNHPDGESSRPAGKTSRSGNSAPGEKAATSADAEVVSLLKSQIEKLETENERRVREHQEDKHAFREQIQMFKEMFDTLKDDHADTKSLLKEVHGIIGKLAEPNPLAVVSEPSRRESKTPSKNIAVVDAEPIEKVASAEETDATTEEKTTPEKRKARPPESPHRPQPRKRTRMRTRKKNPAQKKKPSVFEKHTPTFHKAVSGFLRKP